MIHDLKRQGLPVSAIARQVGLDPKTVRRHLTRGIEPPVYGPRPPRPRQLEPYEPYLRERVAAYPGLSGKRLLREIHELGYTGCYSIVTDFLRTVRPAAADHASCGVGAPASRPRLVAVGASDSD